MSKQIQQVSSMCNPYKYVYIWSTGIGVGNGWMYTCLKYFSLRVANDFLMTID